MIDNTQNRKLTKIYFQLKIYKSNGQDFENLFHSVMKSAHSNFRNVAPYGNVGDRGNDGFIKNEGIYYQVYAPNDLHKKETIASAVSKLENDFGLKLYPNWANLYNVPLKKFYFVMNDKYNGTIFPVEQQIGAIEKAYNIEAESFLAQNLEDVFMNDLTLEQQEDIIGHIPITNKLPILKIETLKQVIDHLLRSKRRTLNEHIPLNPKMYAKIQHNSLDIIVKGRLDYGASLEYNVEDYFAERYEERPILQNVFNTFYQESLSAINEYSKDSNLIFWDIYIKINPEKIISFEAATFALMSYYFKMCDIFEEPPEDTESQQTTLF